MDNLRKNHCLISDDILKSVDAILSLSYFVRKSLPNKETYGGESIVEHKNKKYSLNKRIREELINQNFIYYLGMQLELVYFVLRNTILKKFLLLIKDILEWMLIVC